MKSVGNERRRNKAEGIAKELEIRLRRAGQAKGR